MWSFDECRCVQEGVSRVVWSYSYADPSSTDNVMIHDRKGSVSINFFSGTGSVKSSTLEGSYETYDILNKNVSHKRASMCSTGLSSVTLGIIYFSTNNFSGIK